MRLKHGSQNQGGSEILQKQQHLAESNNSDIKGLVFQSLLFELVLSFRFLRATLFIEEPRYV